MAIVYKCKCCAANLDVEEGMRLAKCPACKTKQTLPSSRDENIQNLFNRATTLRLKSEFDKAETVYERIIQADEEQYEAYWGLILCKFGVEYVEDPKTETRIPTCHRTSFESIVADENYKLALKYALDEDQQELYKQDAQEIDKIQKGILQIVQNEEPYDVFICYKETDENGKRTMDSVIANDIYHQLTQEGFKVFYAAITLEGKLGSAYEPIIFAALNSAKVMLAVGTKPEYFQAVWVKNEWSRFLKMNKKDRNKLLIPCYKGMDAYDLPDEFAHLQAQDMSKIGFINDLVRGIKKVMEKSEEKGGVTGGSTKNLLKRAYMFLNDGDFENAKIYCNKVLDIDAENAEAYLYNLLVRLGIPKKENLEKSTADFSNYPEYKRAYLYGDDQQKKLLSNALGVIRENLQQKAETAAKQKRKNELERAIMQDKKQIEEIKARKNKLNAEIISTRKNIEQVSKKIRKAKVWAGIHFVFFLLFVAALVLMVNAIKSGEVTMRILAIAFAAVSMPMLVISLVVMMRANPNKYTSGTIAMYVLLMIVYDVIGIVFVVKTFRLSIKNICQKESNEAREKAQQILRNNKQLEELEERLKDNQKQLKEFVKEN